MAAALVGLRTLLAHDAGPHRNLTHYFTNILKQAAEGKLGRAYEYHRAPAPFVQVSCCCDRVAQCVAGAALRRGPEVVAQRA